MTFSDLTARLTAEYDLFLFALSGRYQQLRAPGGQITPRAILDLNCESY